jgi:uncharacterized phiE125 gp8 family phage protein
MYPPYGGAFTNQRGNYGGLVPYGTLALTESSPEQSFEEPLTTPNVQAYLRIEVDDTEGGLLAGMITAARSAAELMQGRDLVRKQWDLTLDYWPDGPVQLRPDLVSVDLVRSRDNTGAYTLLVEDTDYVVDASKKPGIITPPWGTTWPTYTPWPSSSLLVRFTSGLTFASSFWKGPGARVKMGMHLLISEWYNNRLPFGVNVEELPYKIKACLGWGAVARVK